MNRKNIFQALSTKLGISHSTEHKIELTEMGRVVPDANRCVQCGICSYNCPLGIPVRDFARQGLPVDDPHCITCSQCINVCPRGTLRWETKAHALLKAQQMETNSPLADLFFTEKTLTSRQEES